MVSTLGCENKETCHPEGIRQGCLKDLSFQTANRVG
jgi:hypothetical protein